MKKRQKKINVEEVATSLLAYLVKTNLGYPVYVDEFHFEEDCQQIGLFPVVYVWSNFREGGNYSVSVNGNAIAHLLEAVVPRNHPKFNIIRDKVLRDLSQTSSKTVAEMCGKFNMSPKVLFKPENAEELIEQAK